MKRDSIKCEICDDGDIYNADGTKPHAVRATSDGRAYTYDTNGNMLSDSKDRQLVFGIAGDKPVTGDWNLDGGSDLAIYRGSGQWQIDSNGNGTYNSGMDRLLQFGQTGDVAVSGDWIGDGVRKSGVFRPSNNHWQHHIMVRGIDKTDIFRDDRDRSSFLERLALIVSDSDCAVHAWALMRNHVHILFRSGTSGISVVMRKLLTWYAQYFNRRHARTGHLFENRYISILCDEDGYGSSNTHGPARPSRRLSRRNAERAGSVLRSCRAVAGAAW